MKYLKSSNAYTTIKEEAKERETDVSIHVSADADNNKTILGWVLGGGGCGGL